MFIRERFYFTRLTSLVFFFLLFFHAGRLFPFNDLSKWIFDDEHCDKREFGFTPYRSDQFFWRRKNFFSARSWQDYICSVLPKKIDIGMVCIDGNEVLKELVFDIDLDDYDSIRNCCKNYEMCNDCLVFIQTSIYVLKYVLSRVFGLTKLMFVASGRRGVHCWVLDQNARTFDSTYRSAISEMLNMIDNPQKKYIRSGDGQLIFNPVFDDLLYTFSIPVFEKLLPNIQKTKLMNVVLKMCPTEKRDDLAILLNLYQNNIDMWNMVKSVLNTNHTHCLIDIVFAFIFPILDKNVTTQINHLIKIPFSPHPETHRISLPFDEERLASVEDLVMPTLFDLVKENEDGWNKKKFINAQRIFQEKVF